MKRKERTNNGTDQGAGDAPRLLTPFVLRRMWPRSCRSFVWLDAPEHRIASFNLAEPPISHATSLIPKPALPAEINAVWVAPTPAGKGTVGPHWHSNGGPRVQAIWTVPDEKDIDLVSRC